MLLRKSRLFSGDLQTWKIFESSKTTCACAWSSSIATTGLSEELATTRPIFLLL